MQKHMLTQRFSSECIFKTREVQHQKSISLISISPSHSVKERKSLMELGNKENKMRGDIRTRRPREILFLFLMVSINLSFGKLMPIPSQTNTLTTFWIRELNLDNIAIFMHDEQNLSHQVYKWCHINYLVCRKVTSIILAASNAVHHMTEGYYFS